MTPGRKPGTVVPPSWTPDKEMVWRNPPPAPLRKPARLTAKEVWLMFVNELAAKPNQWAVWVEGRRNPVNMTSFRKGREMTNILAVSRRDAPDSPTYGVFVCYLTDASKLSTIDPPTGNNEDEHERVLLAGELVEGADTLEISEKRKGGAIAPVIPPESLSLEPAEPKDYMPQPDEVWGWQCCSCDQWRSSAARLKAHTKQAHGRAKLNTIESMEPVLIPVEYQGDSFSGNA